MKQIDHPHKSVVAVIVSHSPSSSTIVTPKASVINVIIGQKN